MRCHLTGYGQFAVTVFRCRRFRWRGVLKETYLNYPDSAFCLVFWWHGSGFKLALLILLLSKPTELAASVKRFIGETVRGESPRRQNADSANCSVPPFYYHLTPSVCIAKQYHAHASIIACLLFLSSVLLLQSVSALFVPSSSLSYVQSFRVTFQIR